MRRIVVIGGGAAGLMAAYCASRDGNQVVLIEKNEKLGKKIYITGKGRCNLTNAVSADEFLSNVISNPKFVYGAINLFPPCELINFMESAGLKIKIERGKRAFPESDKASDVTKTFEKLLLKNDVDLRLNTTVLSVETDNSIVKGVVTDKGFVEADSVIVCTGGISYPSTGSTGDGYKFASDCGHSLIKAVPSLVGLNLSGDFYKQVQGVSLKNVKLTALLGDKVVFSEFGEMLFTHFGISGPIVLSCSAKINRLDFNQIRLQLDLKPALDYKILQDRLIREFDINGQKSVDSAIRSLLPKSMVEPFLVKANVDKNKKCCEIKREERERIVKTLKCFEMKASGLRPIDEAIVTAGGVNVKEINPKTMESKLIKGLFFAGEVLDIDAFTGGFNLQLAFSTGYIAGKNA